MSWVLVTTCLMLGVSRYGGHCNRVYNRYAQSSISCYREDGDGVCRPHSLTCYDRNSRMDIVNASYAIKKTTRFPSCSTEELSCSRRYLRCCEQDWDDVFVAFTETDMQWLTHRCSWKSRCSFQAAADRGGLKNSSYSVVFYVCFEDITAEPSTSKPASELIIGDIVGEVIVVAVVVVIAVIVIVGAVCYNRCVRCRRKSESHEMSCIITEENHGLSIKSDEQYEIQNDDDIPVQADSVCKDSVSPDIGYMYVNSLGVSEHVNVQKPDQGKAGGDDGYTCILVNSLDDSQQLNIDRMEGNYLNGSGQSEEVDAKLPNPDTSADVNYPQLVEEEIIDRHRPDTVDTNSSKLDKDIKAEHWNPNAVADGSYINYPQLHEDVDEKQDNRNTDDDNSYANSPQLGENVYTKLEKQSISNDNSYLNPQLDEHMYRNLNTPDTDGYIIPPQSGEHVDEKNENPSISNADIYHNQFDQNVDEQQRNPKTVNADMYLNQLGEHVHNKQANPQTVESNSNLNPLHLDENMDEQQENQNTVVDDDACSCLNSSQLDEVSDKQGKLETFNDGIYLNSPELQEQVKSCNLDQFDHSGVNSQHIDDQPSIKHHHTDTFNYNYLNCPGLGEQADSQQGNLITEESHQTSPEQGKQMDALQFSADTVGENGDARSRHVIQLNVYEMLDPSIMPHTMHDEFNTSTI